MVFNWNWSQVLPLSVVLVRVVVVSKIFSFFKVPRSQYERSLKETGVWNFCIFGLYLLMTEIGTFYLTLQPTTEEARQKYVGRYLYFLGHSRHFLCRDGAQDSGAATKGL